jgi:4-azaleucine resistance transporter AzlC
LRKLSLMHAPSPSWRSRRREFLAGAAHTLPLLLGAAPFGLIFGALAAPSGLPAAGALAMSAAVFAGSSQFIALTLLAGGAGVWLIVLTTFVVNLRHALYAATLLPHVARLPLRWRAPLAFWLTDETFAVVQQRYAADPGGAAHWYYLGSCLAMYLNWLAWTAIGVWLGHGVPRLQHWGLEFAMAASFTAIVAPSLRRRPMLAAACAAGAVALLGHALPYKLGLLLAAVAGVAAGVLVEEAAA